MIDGQELMLGDDVPFVLSVGSLYDDQEPYIRRETSLLQI